MNKHHRKALYSYKPQAASSRAVWRQQGFRTNLTKTSTGWVLYIYKKRS